MKPLSIHPAAVAELEEAVVYHENLSPGLGRELRLEVLRALERAQANPELCPPHRRTGFRKFFVKRFRYTLFFLELPERIWIAAVAHGSRRPGYWLDRSL